MEEIEGSFIQTKRGKLVSRENLKEKKCPDCWLLLSKKFFSWFYNPPPFSFFFCLSAVPFKHPSLSLLPSFSSLLPFPSSSFPFPFPSPSFPFPPLYLLYKIFLTIL